METNTRIDWLAFTSRDEHIEYPEKFPKDWSNTAPFRGYKFARKFTDGRLESHTDRVDMGTHVQYSGKVLSSLNEHMGALDILRFHNERGARFTRLDVAYDVVNGGINIRKLREDFLNARVDTHAQNCTIIESETGTTLYVGSRTSEAFLRVYDKAGEQGIEGDWIRIEMEYKGDKARNIAKMLLESVDPSLLITQTIKGFCNFYLDDNWSSAFRMKPEMVKSDKKTGGDTVKWLMDTVAPALAKQIVANEEIWIEFQRALQSAIEATKNNMKGDNNQ